MRKATSDVLICIDNISDLLRAGRALSTCDRGRVAAVLSVRDTGGRRRYIIGYSDSLTDETCDSHGHMMENGHCVRTIHAEQMAVAAAAKAGYITHKGVCHVTMLPCMTCLRVLSMAGVTDVYVHDDTVVDTDTFEERKEYAQRLGIMLQSYSVMSE